MARKGIEEILAVRPSDFQREFVFWQSTIILASSFFFQQEFKLVPKR